MYIIYVHVHIIPRAKTTSVFDVFVHIDKESHTYIHTYIHTYNTIHTHVAGPYVTAETDLESELVCVHVCVCFCGMYMYKDSKSLR
jgi:hypothetical protein